jgi:hypothetical protein
MAWWKRLPAGAKVLVVLAAFFGATGMLFGLETLRLAPAKDAVAEIEENWLPSVDIVTQMSAIVQQHRLEQAAHIGTLDDAGKAAADGRMRVLVDRMQELREAYEPLVTARKKERSAVVRFDQSWADYLRISHNVLALSRRNENEQAAKAIRSEQHSAYGGLMRATRDLLRFNLDGIVASTGRSVAVYDQTRLIAIGTLALGGVALLGLGLCAALRHLAHRTSARPTRLARLLSP